MRFSQKEEYLREKDPKLKKIIDDNGHIVFKYDKNNQFGILVEIIISQFISTAAANSIIERIKQEFKIKNFRPTNFYQLPVEEIKELGLSYNKAKSIQELSQAYMKNNLNFLSLSEEETQKTLLSIFGIGPWSINMFEIFCLGKKDIFSSKDAGLRQAMIKSSMVKPSSDWSSFDIYSKKWSPFRTIASLHLWKLID